MFNITLDRERCKGCKLCVDACDSFAIDVSDKSNDYGYFPVVINKEKCNGCGACAIVCPETIIINFTK